MPQQTTQSDTSTTEDALVTARTDGSYIVEPRTSGTGTEIALNSDDYQFFKLLASILDDINLPDTYLARLARNENTTAGVINPIKTGLYANGEISEDMRKEAASVIQQHRAEKGAKTLVAAGCSGSKHDVDGAVPAKELYSGTYWNLKQEYSETYSKDWRVISAKHDVLDPETPIRNYECVPSDLEGIPVDSDDRLPNGGPVETLQDQWAYNVYKNLQRWINQNTHPYDPRDVELQILLSANKYVPPLETRGVFNALSAPSSLTIRFPFAEEEQAQGGIGHQQGWMSDMIEAAHSEDE